jgi:hypothetical protein
VKKNGRCVKDNEDPPARAPVSMQRCDLQRETDALRLPPGKSLVNDICRWVKPQTHNPMRIKGATCRRVRARQERQPTAVAYERNSSVATASFNHNCFWHDADQVTLWTSVRSLRFRGLYADAPV